MNISNKKIATIYLTFIMFLPNTIFLINKPGLPLISYKRLYIGVWVVFYIALLLKSKNLGLEILKFPLYRGCMYISLLLGFVTLFTFRNNPLAVSGYTSLILETILPMFMIWTAYKSSYDVLRVVKISVYFYTVMALYGVVAYLYGWNPLLDMLVSEDGPRRLLFSYDGNSRGGIEGRAQSFFSHPLHLGYMSSIFVVFVFGIQNRFKLFSLFSYLSILFILIASIILAGSRSPIFLLLISVIIYMIYSNAVNTLKIFIFTLLGSFFIVTSGLRESILGKYLPLITSIFTEFTSGDSGFGGSSLNMRLSQLETAYDIFIEKPIFGYGLNHIRLLLENDLAPGLLGAESFALNVINFGVVGSIGFFLLYKNILLSFLRGRRFIEIKNNKKIAITGMAMLGGHLAFVFATGEQGMLYFYLTITTLMLRIIYLDMVTNKNMSIVYE